MFIDNDLYKKIIETSIIPTLDIIFLNKKNQILLGLRTAQPLQGVYYIPGGRRWKGESMIQSAQRKAKEELSIDIDTQKLIFLGIYDDIFDESAFDAISTHCSPVTYVYRLNETEESLIAPDIQHKDLQYFDLDDTSLHAMVKIRIKDIKKLNLLNQE